MEEESETPVAPVVSEVEKAMNLPLPRARSGSVSSNVSASSRLRFQVEQVKDEPTINDEPSAKTVDEDETWISSPDSRRNSEAEDMVNPLLGPDSSGIITNGYPTIGFPTAEAIPMTMFYRNDDSKTNPAKSRPTLDELRKGFDGDEKDPEREALNPQEAPVQTKVTFGKASAKFGWIKGVVVPCLLNIWGVMLYLRLPWVFGQSGVLLGSVIILLSAVVTTLTTLSVSAVCSNGEIKGGGAYYLISRSLGPEFGGSIGLIFSVANAVAISMYIVGFAETVRDIMKEHDALMVDEMNDVRIIGLITIIFLVMIALVGLEWVIRAQIILFFILVLSILVVIVGAFIGPLNTTLEAQGVVHKLAMFGTNVMPDFQEGESFFSAFSIFFPAATGILAGVNISGDLKNPQKAIPKGTLLAILISTVVYLLLGWLIAGAGMREATGIIPAVMNSNGTSANLTNTMTCATMECTYGLLHDFQIMGKVAAWGPIVTCGIFAATLSSALASFVGAPKTFQAVCKDNIFPGIGYFAKGVGQSDEPRRGYVLSFIIAVCFIAIAELNVIAPLISNFFLVSYALINYSCFASSLGKSPGWRPSFKYYNMWVSLFGSLVCVAIMFLINWWCALVTIVIVASLYKYVDYSKPKNTNWGSSTQAYSYTKALEAAYHLDNTEDHTKNYRPQCLALTGQPSSRPTLTHFASHFTKNVGLLLCGQVNIQAEDNFQARVGKDENTWLRKHKIRGFHIIGNAGNLRKGVSSFMQLSGLGKMRPNMLLLGFKRDWKVQDKAVVEEYVHIIQDAFNSNQSVAVLWHPDGFDITDDTDNEPEGEWDSLSGNGGAAQPDAGKSVIFTDIEAKGTIDVWWLYDDGGLTILISYLLTQHQFWKGNKLRIFTQKSAKHSIKSDKLRMANLLKKFRIGFSSIVELEGTTQRPSDESIDLYKTLPCVEPDQDIDNSTLRQIRVGEMLRQHSSDAKLIVVTLPVPKISQSALNYMSWLDVLSSNLPPTLLIRGNQDSVLTFYS